VLGYFRKKPARPSLVFVSAAIAVAVAMLDLIRGHGELVIPVCVCAVYGLLGWYLPPIRVASTDPSKSTIQRIREKRRARSE
jgi:hypothetical protein